MPYVEDLFTKEELDVYHTTRAENFVTCIDNRFAVTDIANFDTLPARIRDEIKSVDCLRSYGFQELCGYRDNTCMFSCGGHWTSDENPDPNAKFIVTSYGSHNLQWDGQRVTSTVKVYV